MIDNPIIADDESDEADDGLNLGFLDAMDDEEVLALSDMIGPVWDKLSSAVPAAELGSYAAFGALVELVRELATEIEQNDSSVDDDIIEERAA
jgi:hypothetical protein